MTVGIRLARAKMNEQKDCEHKEEDRIWHMTKSVCRKCLATLPPKENKE